MPSFRSFLLLFVTPLSFATPVLAGSGYVLGIGGEADNEDGSAVSGFVDYGFTEQTWLSAAISRTSTNAVAGGLDTLYTDVGLEHSFGLIGIRAAAAYWGNNDILDSEDLRAGVFLRAKKGSLSLDFERRDFDFTFHPLSRPDIVRKEEFSANGFGAAVSLQLNDTVRLFASGMRYDYSRNIRLQPRIDLLLHLSASRLSLINSLIDHRFSGGIGFRLGKRSVDVTLSSWQTAVDGDSVQSIAVGFVTPMSPASDVEIRLAYDKPENFGDTLALAITLYFFGG